MLHKVEEAQLHEECDLIFINSLLLVYHDTLKQVHDVIEIESLVNI